MNVGICAVGSAWPASDTTTLWLPRRLAEAGLDVAWHISAGDDRHRILAALRWLIRNCGAVVMTSGELGPEDADLPGSVAAEAAGVPLVRGDSGGGRSSTGGRPAGSMSLEPIGAAEGFVLETDRPTGGSVVVYALRATALELRAMTERDVLPDLARRCDIATVAPQWAATDEERVEQIVSRLLRNSHRTVATAESCTAGAVVTRLAAVPGASAYLRGGLVAYASEVKSSVLRIDGQLLEQHGPVSIPTTEAMARRARELFDADLGLGVTCVAGPDVQGGRRVGTTIWALATREGNEESGELEISGDRPAVQAGAANVVLDVLRRHLLATSTPGSGG